MKGKGKVCTSADIDELFTFGHVFVNLKSGEALWVLWAIMASPAEIPPIRPTLIICRWAGPGRPFVWSFLCDRPHHTLTHAHTNPALPSAIYRKLYSLRDACGIGNQFFSTQVITSEPFAKIVYLNCRRGSRGLFLQ